jgi:hypothetical protein
MITIVKSREAGMISELQQKVSAWVIDSKKAAVNGPPKDPDDDEDEDEEDEEDDEENPAVIREPDE